MVDYKVVGSWDILRVTLLPRVPGPGFFAGGGSIVGENSFGSRQKVSTIALIAVFSTMFIGSKMSQNSNVAGDFGLYVHCVKHHE